MNSRVQETVVVVGGTGEMGQLICQQVAEEGYDVLAVARTEAALGGLVKEHDNIRACVADISNDDATGQIAAHLSQPVRALVHGPGVATAGGVLTAPTSALSEAVNIKVGGMVRLVRACDPYLVAGSRLIAIGGHYGFEPTAYAATAGIANAAVANLIRQYSLAYGDRDITAHLLAPGPADSQRLKRVAQARAEREGVDVESVYATMQGESAINKFTPLGSVAWAVKLLLDPMADALAGSTLFMDAGRRRASP